MAAFAPAPPAPPGELFHRAPPPPPPPEPPGQAPGAPGSPAGNSGRDSPLRYGTRDGALFWAGYTRSIPHPPPPPEPPALSPPGHPLTAFDSTGRVIAVPPVFDAKISPNVV